MDMEDVESCNICMNSYDQNVRPRSLPCGHSICGTCITNSIRNARLKCPQCQQVHKFLGVDSFPINYGMEELISQIRKLKMGAMPKDHSASEFRCLQSGGKWQEVFNKQKNSLRNLIAIGDKIEVDWSQYKDFLHQRKAKHDHIIPQLYDLAKQHEEISSVLASEEKIVTEAMEEGKYHKKRATETLCKYDQVTSTVEFAEASHEVTSCCSILDEWRIRRQMQLPNVKTMRTSHMLLNDTIAALREITSEDQDSVGETIDLSASNLSVMDKIRCMGGEATFPVSVLQKRSESVKILLKKGHIYAIQTELGKTRCARMTLSNDKIYLHHLQDGEPPAYAHTVKYSELINCLNKDSVSVFMDLSWEGSIRGRLHILLSPDTPLARHFRCLCCGDSGPSYAHSTLLEVAWKGNNTHEFVIGGDYEKRDGSGGAPLMKGLNPQDGIYTRKYEEGIVYTRYNNVQDGPKISEFGILSGKGDSRTMYGVFGRVQEGLETVKEAAKLDDIRKVIIEDCGVILNF